MEKKIQPYDPNERAAEKQRSRRTDEADLAAGRVSREQLRQRNGFLSGLDIVSSRIVCAEDFE